MAGSLSDGAVRRPEMSQDETYSCSSEVAYAEIDVSGNPIRLEIPAGVHLPTASSIEMANLFDIEPGEDALDLGCGCGILAISAAKRGAGRVVATDADLCAVASTLRNAVNNGVRQQVEGRTGSWYNALHQHPDGIPELFQVILAAPPQTPAPRPCGPRYGGWDGMDHLRQVIDGAQAFLDRPAGRLWLMTISLANPESLMRHLSRKFSDVVLVKETKRLFSIEEYDALTPGLFQHLLELRNEGHAEFEEAGNGRYSFRNLFIRAAGHCNP